MARQTLRASVDEIERRWSEAAAAEPPLLLTPAWWQERILDWATADPDFRTKLLRFVDVLPALRDARAVADHVRQYFGDTRQQPIPIATGIGAQPPFRPVLSKIVREGVFAMAHRFIAGESPDAALTQLRRLAAGGTAATVDLLGEATHSDAEADAYAGRYMSLLQTLASDAQRLTPPGDRWRDVPAVNISVKLSALGARMTAAAPGATSEDIRKRLRPLLALARARNAHLQIDMEQYRSRDLVQRAFEDAVLEPDVADYSNVGIVVQAYLRDAVQDIERFRQLAERRGAPLTIRLVKGAYWDEERIVAAQNSWPVPVFERIEETHGSFEDCVDAILDAWPALHPAFGSHNPRSVAYAAAASQERGLQPSDIEFQTLFGMAEGLRNAIASEGYRTRVYVPVGATIPGMAYLVRRLLENTSNQAWFVGPFGRDVPAVQTKPADSDGSREAFENTPPARFHEPADRERMAAAIEGARAAFGMSVPLVIGGHKVFDREKSDVRYPADPGLVVGRVAQATADDANEAVALAVEAFPDWRDLPSRERAVLLRRAAEIMTSRRFELAAIEVFESGKPWEESDADVAEAIDYLRYYAGQAERLGETRVLGRVPGERNEYFFEGRGVAAIVAPWNFPLAIITGMSSAALVAGNCAILKPSGYSPIIAHRLAEILHEAGVPGSVVHYLPGAGDTVGQTLVDHPNVATIAFTGSSAVGQGILQSAATVRPAQTSIKRVIAEMGGKNAIIIDDDAELDEALAGVLASAFGYAGQKCSAASRLIVVGRAYAETVSRLRDAVESLVVGLPDDPATFVPPVISASARAGIQRYIDEPPAGARLLAQARTPDGPGHYVAPTVFTDVGLDTPLAGEEIFGPVLSVFHARDFEDALDIAMHSSYALTGGVFSRNPRNIERARRRFRVGNLYINRKITGAMVCRQPFGGLRLSGYGEKAGGPDYLRQFMEPRVVTENTVRRGFAPG